VETQDDILSGLQRRRKHEVLAGQLVAEVVREVNAPLEDASKWEAGAQRGGTMSATVIVSFRAKPEQAPALLTFLSGLQPGMLAAGAQTVSLLQDQDDPTRVFEIEEWASSDAHKRFVAQAAAAGAFAPFDELLVTPFEVTYANTVARSEAGAAGG
jgi:quinol monooxygenase YgiN